MKKNKKEEIIKIASKHFAKKGFNQTSLEEIAKEAKVTKAAIYYHFKDKAALYEETLLKDLKLLAKTVQEKVSAANSPEQKLKNYIKSFGEFLDEKKNIAAILTYEFASEGENLPNSAAKELSKTLSVLTSIINEGIEKKIFVTENPMAIQMMIRTPLIMYQTTYKMRQKVISFIDKEYKVSPKPDIKNLSDILAKKILIALKGEKKDV